MSHSPTRFSSGPFLSLHHVSGGGATNTASGSVGLRVFVIVDDDEGDGDRVLHGRIMI